ncbi:hypothetical protein Q2K19_25260 [Micromonospora soli]|uniref:hypothetical protein n=1 Tax=Micromonospora sp. NBRC 110009 TaxID=3061627 RepID=UPI0026736279|nr:hypothetical protein [Micromonospora sp. NBRC 110009]WKT97461.1 hypothetical protein Q2K19_25260 [Micromonospora sp. NBRC 110009]
MGLWPRLQGRDLLGEAVVRAADLHGAAVVGHVSGGDRAVAGGAGHAEPRDEQQHEDQHDGPAVESFGANRADSATTPTTASTTRPTPMSRRRVRNLPQSAQKGQVGALTRFCSTAATMANGSTPNRSRT